MREFSGQDSRTLAKVFCNCCGKELSVRNGIIEEGCISTEVQFGFFSRRDGLVHRFDLCEDCYDRLTAEFRIPIEVEEKTELL